MVFKPRNITFKLIEHSLMSLFFMLFTISICAQNESEDIHSMFKKMTTYMYTNKDSTFHYSNAIVSASKDPNTYTNVIYAYLYANKSAAYFNDFCTLKRNIEKIDSIFSAREDALSQLDRLYYIKNSANYDKGVYFYKLNDYTKARDALKSIIDVSQSDPRAINNNPNNDLVYGAYTTIAKMYSNDGKYEMAKDYYSKAIRFLNTHAEDAYSVFKLNRIYSLIGEIYKKQNQPLVSNTYYKKSLKQSIVFNNANGILTEANTIAENYISLKLTDSAEFYLKQMEPFLEDSNPYTYKYYKTVAQLAHLYNDTVAVVANFNKALLLNIAKWNTKKHIETAEISQELSKFYSAIQQYPKALLQINKAIENVSGDNVISSSVNNTMLFRLLKIKAQLLNTTRDYENALKTVHRAVAILDILKPSFKNNTDKLLLINDAYPLIETGLDATYNLYGETKNEALIDHAFFLTEKNKSVLLLDALLTSEAFTYANIPNHIIEKEHILKYQITALEKELNTNTNTDKKDELFELQLEYRELIEGLEKDHINYYNLKYNQDVVTANQLQKSLKTKEAIIAFFYGNSFIYRITITNSTKELKRIRNTKALQTSLLNFQKLISSPTSNRKNLATISKELFAILMPKTFELEKIKNLVIIPDGLLNYIPFGALESLNTEYNYAIQEYEISYINSATLLEQLKGKKKNNGKLLAFAPTFAGKISTLLPLPNTAKEIRSLANHFKSDLYFDTQANLKAFDTLSSKYSILHLATHAVFNNSTPEYSYLAFSANIKNENLLYVKDLYNLKLNADLVTLSACDTGMGELKRGEGLLSLARGFYFSGASSLASTLWKINDASSSQLMDAFYSNLASGQPKDKSLQAAKLEFINSNKETGLSHPYYWSGFIISGNTTPLQTTTNYTVYIIGIVALLIILLLIKNRRKLT
ncbi:CHAT domain-containing protein [Bizionia gelidisalsuginis]|uniref:CHAT domain-containing protein n=2 Tax=Bizionia gelidisalsuginis TaxID=291188 RepID=A0ABY3M7B9_9FLAO|nr:CHAT domain-containing protein [Bizionia gelidisalsuginis]